jgi:hypothetical protein
VDDTVAQPMLSAAERKRRAKRFNTDAKLTATTILTRGTAFITPLVHPPDDVFTDNGWAFLVAAFLRHRIVQTAIRLFLRAEE